VGQELLVYELGELLEGGVSRLCGSQLGPGCGRNSESPSDWSSIIPTPEAPRPSGRRCCDVSTPRHVHRLVLPARSLSSRNRERFSGGGFDYLLLANTRVAFSSRSPEEHPSLAIVKGKALGCVACVRKQRRSASNLLAPVRKVLESVGRQKYRWRLQRSNQLASNAYPNRLREKPHQTANQ